MPRDRAKVYLLLRPILFYGLKEKNIVDRTCHLFLIYFYNFRSYINVIE